MIEFTCEHCGKMVNVVDQHAGKEGKCPAGANCQLSSETSMLGQPNRPDAGWASSVTAA